MFQQKFYYSILISRQLSDCHNLVILVKKLTFPCADATCNGVTPFSTTARAISSPDEELKTDFTTPIFPFSQASKKLRVSTSAISTRYTNEELIAFSCGQKESPTWHKRSGNRLMAMSEILSFRL